MRSWIIYMCAAALGAGCSSKSTSPAEPSSEKPAPDSKPQPKSPLAANADYVLDRLEQVETAADVTCWTSFRQLDWIIAEKPYTEFGTIAKVASIKALVRAVWALASRSSKESTVSAAALAAIPINSVEDMASTASAAGQKLGIRQYKDYKSTAEDWRVILTVIQDEVAKGSKAQLKPLTNSAFPQLAHITTTLSLTLLRASGQAAKADAARAIDGPHVTKAFGVVATKYKLDNAPSASGDVPTDIATRDLVPITKSLINGKVNALRKYNKASSSLIEDLTKVSQLPIAPGALKIFTLRLQSLVRFVAAGFDPMRADNYLSDGSYASAKLTRRAYLDHVAVANTMAQLFPYRMASNGDVVVRFVPNPGPIAQSELTPFDVKLLDHQMNGVRDSAIHWQIMQAEWIKKPFAMDPFAAEYLSEGVSIMLTLYLRRAHTLATQQGKTEIDEAIAKQVNDRRFVVVPSEATNNAKWKAAKTQKKRAVLATVGKQLFRDATKQAGFTKNAKPVDRGGFDIQKIMGGGVAVGDVNGDGFADLFITGEGQGRLYLNQGTTPGPRFKDATNGWGIPEPIHDAHGALFVDIDGDDDLDLIVLRSKSESLVLLQTDRRFANAAKRLGFSPGRGAHVASVFDYDLDGDLDIHVGYYGSHVINSGKKQGRSKPSMDGRNGTPNQLWQQQSDGAFREVGDQAGIAHPGWALATHAFDLEMDGDLDLYVANDFGANVLHKNNGDGTFTDITDTARVGDRGSGMNADVTDVNGDGRWDVYVTNIDMYSKRIKVVFPRDESTFDVDESLAQGFQYLSGNKFYVSQPSGQFAAEGNQRLEPGDRGWGWDANFFDVDLDGDDDLYLNNGWIEGAFAGNQANQMFINDGGTFFLGPPDSAERFRGNSRSAAAVDVNRDGLLDLVVTNFRQPPRLLLNHTRRRGGWLGLRLRGAGKNSRAVGALIRAKLGSRTILRHVSAGRGYLSQADPVVHIGTGRAKTVDLTIVWPNGQSSRHTQLASNRLHALSQPQ